MAKGRKQVRITENVIRSEECSEGQSRREIWDSVSHGLVLRVTPNGAKSWYAYYFSPIHKRAAKLKLGDYKATDASIGLTITQARDRNAEARDHVQAGRDPRIELERRQSAERARIELEQREKSGATFQALTDEYLAEKQGLRAGSLKCYRSVLDIEILPAIGTKLVKELTALDFELIVERVAKRGKKARARTVKTALGSIWGWARRTAKWRAMGITRDLLLEINPELTRKEEGGARKRKLTDAELKHLWEAVDACNLGLPTKVAFKLTVLLGERSTELLHAPWSEIVDLDGSHPQWELPAGRHKGKSDKVLPLPPLAVALLKELHAITGKTGWLIPGRGSEAKQVLAGMLPAHAGLLTGSIRHLRNQGLLTCEPFSPHDLRRTMAHRMEHDLDLSEEAIKAVLGHSRQDVTQRHYTQSQKLKKKLAALVAWEERVKAIVGIAPIQGSDNVLELRRPLQSA